MVRVLAFGTFDLFHKGHESYLNQAKKLGDELIVVVALDSTVGRVKGKTPFWNEKKRLEVVSAFSAVNKAVLGKKGNVYWVLDEFKPDIIALGYDQSYFTDRLQEELGRRGMKSRIVRLQPYLPEKYKSSKINQGQHG